MHSRTDLLAYDPERQEFSPYLADIGAATYVALSRDRLWISYITPNDSSLWRSRVDGSDRLQLTSAPMQVFTMSWSPDAKYLALMGRTTGKPGDCTLFRPAVEIRSNSWRMSTTKPTPVGRRTGTCLPTDALLSTWQSPVAPRPSRYMT